MKKIMIMLMMLSTFVFSNVDSCRIATYELEVVLKVNNFYGRVDGTGNQDLMDFNADAARKVLNECKYRNTRRANKYKAKARKLLYYDKKLRSYDGNKSYLYGYMEYSCWNLLRVTEIIDGVIRRPYKDPNDLVFTSSTGLVKKFAVKADVACDKIRDYDRMDKAQIIYNVYDRY